MCAGSGRIPGTPEWSRGNCRLTRCWPPGSMSSSGRWTCAPPGCPAPCANCECAPTSICSRKLTAGFPRPPPAEPPGQTAPPFRTTRMGPATQVAQEAAPGGPDSGPGPPPPGGPGPGGPGPGGPGRGPQGNGPAGSGPGGCARPARQDNGPSLAALVNITVPLAALTGDSGPPGEAAGFGLLDSQSLRDLVTAASRNPNTRWCLTALHPDGTAAAHGCAPGPRPWPPGRHDSASDAEPPGPLKLADQQAAGLLRALTPTLNIVIRGPCNHAQAQASYRPSRALRHLITARNTRCTAPGSGRPAARCDLDHTQPWHHDGKTCPCNLAPLQASPSVQTSRRLVARAT